MWQWGIISTSAVVDFHKLSGTCFFTYKYTFALLNHRYYTHKLQNGLLGPLIPSKVLFNTSLNDWFILKNHSAGGLHYEN